MADNFDIQVRMHNISDGDNYNDVITVHKTELIADLMTRAIERYNSKRDCTVVLHCSSPFIFSGTKVRHPRHHAITKEIKTCGDLQQLIKTFLPKAVFPTVYALVVPNTKNKHSVKVSTFLLIIL